jgi:CRISPR-associated protein Csb2
MGGLTVEIELLTGAYRAALPDGTSAEWPPHPERVFSALVQAWGDADRVASEKAALEWLEQLEPPVIEADPPTSVSLRTAPSVFVPPNDFEISDPGKPLSWPTDAKTGRPKPIGDIAWSGVEPSIRSGNFRQPRTFQVAVPSTAIVRMIWDAAPPREVNSALGALASRVSSLGHSASLARMAIRDDAQPERERLWQPAADGPIALRVPYTGRLADLERWLAADERPRSPASRRYHPPGRERAEPIPESVFATDWLVFEGVSGFQPDVLGFAHVAKRVRDALMASSPVQPVSEIISGHASDGSPSQVPHLAVVPLLDVGWDYSVGDLLGFALVPPRSLSPDLRTQFLRSVAHFAKTSTDGEFYATLRLTRERSWRVQRSPSPSRASLRPDRWSRPSYTWMSVTPVVLDRFPEKDDPAEMAELIAKACQRVALPEPVEIQFHKHSGVRGALTSYPARGSQARPDWSFPRDSRLSGRPRRHVFIRFAERVRGPLILGAGRYQGFGLCLPVEEPNP